MKTTLFPTLLCSLLLILAAPTAAARTIEFTTTEVTEADVTVSPDGQWLIFTMLGHLFRLPVTGGTAEQLTFGPYYDNQPTFSPDGKQVAFISDRDGSEGNIFVLRLADGRITQVTHEPWATRPVWSPDGQAVFYLRTSLQSPETVLGPTRMTPEVLPSLVCRIAASGGESEVVTSEPQPITSIFFLPDGRLGRTLVELAIVPETDVLRATTQIQLTDSVGKWTAMRPLEGYAAVAAPSPQGDGLYVRRFSPLPDWEKRPPAELFYFPFRQGTGWPIFVLPQPLGWTPRFGVSAANESLYMGDGGRLWKIPLRGGPREVIPFRAHVQLETYERVPPAKWERTTSANSVRPRSILDPRLSPDGNSLVFEALGHLWLQRLNGGAAQRLFKDEGTERYPAFSPDGRLLAFVHSVGRREELRVFSFENGEMQTLASGQFLSRPSWSPDGQRVVFAENFSLRLDAVSLRERNRETLGEFKNWWWSSRPHFSGDGRSLYFSDFRNGRGALYRLRIEPGAASQRVTQLARHLSDGLLSPDGKWLAFRRNTEIWVTPVGKEPITEESVRRISLEGGETFSFTPDGSALIYSTGNQVWRDSLVGSTHDEIPIRLEFPHPTVAPLLIRRVRVLDFTSGGFGQEISLLVEDGRIRWIGDEREHKVPPGTRTLDAAGRFAIPGLFDLHVHGNHIDGALLAYGVTSVRNTSAASMRLNAEADREELTGEPVPRLFFSGELFDGEQPTWGDMYLIIDNEDDARAYVRRFKKRGVSFLKVYFSLPWRLQRAVAFEARRQGLMVVGQGTHIEEIVKGVTLGFGSLEHMTYPTHFYDDVLQMLAAAGTAWVPTLVKIAGPLWVQEEPERLADAKLRALSPEMTIRWAQNDLRLVGTNQARGRLALQLANVRSALQRGVNVLIGSDWALAASTHWELEAFAQSGLSPVEVLRIATQQAAEALGAQDDLGTLEPGKLADIVLLDKNPLEDIRNTQTIWRVIKGGWLFDPEKLRPPESADAEQ